MTTHELCAKLDTKLDGATADSTIERTLREMQAGGLVDGFHEPYIAPRYQITKKGRERLV
jgi:DNA-binding PadR family transcriptional regulator